MRTSEQQATLAAWDAAVAAWRMLRALDATLGTGTVSHETRSALYNSACRAYGAALAALALSDPALGPVGLVAEGVA